MGLPLLVGLGLALALLRPALARAQAETPSPSQGMLALPAGGAAAVESPHAIAVRARWVTVPGWTLSPYVAAHTELNDGWSVAVEYLNHRARYDIVVSLDYSWLSARDGNYLGNGNDPATQTHYVHFDTLSSLSADVSIIAHWNLTPWFELRLGGGLGLGAVIGNVYQITDNSGCTAANAGDPSKCYPKNIGPITQANADTQTKLENARCSPDFTDGGRDTPGSPCYRRTDTYPFIGRVVPVLNAMFGLRFRLYQRLYLHLDTGFRLAGFFAGGGPEYRF
jgi:hypothetical protein